jgi:hypothetical protein
MHEHHLRSLLFLIPDFFRSASDLTSQLAATRAELATLQERYDALRADRDRLAQTLAENMKKWKRFKRWIFTAKVKVPSKSDHDQISACSSSTPALQQQSAVKMLETPMTPMSSSFFISVMRGWQSANFIQSLDQLALVQSPPRPSPQVHGEAPSHRTSIYLTPRGAFFEPS